MRLSVICRIIKVKVSIYTNHGLDNSSYYARLEFNNCFSIYFKGEEKLLRSTTSSSLFYRILAVFHKDISRRLLYIIQLISCCFWNLFSVIFESVRFPKVGESHHSCYVSFGFVSRDVSRWDGDVAAFQKFCKIPRYYVVAWYNWDIPRNQVIVCCWRTDMTISPMALSQLDITNFLKINTNFSF